MATRATESIGHGGLVATYNTASSGGDKVLPGEGTLLHVKNGGAGALTVTLKTPGKVDGLDIDDRDVTVPGSGESFIPVLAIYRDPADGLASITWGSTSSVTFAVVRA